MMVMLLGAGASYGSSSAGAPPMGEALFDALRGFNPTGWGALPVAQATEFRADFERGMASLAAENPHWMPVLQRAMAAFFFQFTPGADSLFLELARRMDSARWSGAIATLNYERLLELSLLQSGLQPVIGTAASSRQVELCLPHGCCHIFCDGVRTLSAGVSFSGIGVAFDGPVSVVSAPHEYRARLEGDAVPPVMSYFEASKATSAGISFIRGQRQRWAELAGRASRLAIIGVRCRPHDAHVWRPIAASDAEVVYCAGRSSGREFSEWAALERRGKKSRTLPGYFAEEFATVCGTVGLNRT